MTREFACLALIGAAGGVASVVVVDARLAEWLCLSH